MKSFFQVISGAFLIAGCAVGAGMLGIPLVTAASGFWPAFAVTALVWLFMLCTGFLYLEVTLWMPDGGHILTMAQRFLGRKWQFFSGVMFAFLYYALMIAYFAAGAPLLATILGDTLSPLWAYILFGALFGTVVGIGPKVIDRTNIILTVGLVISLVWLLSVSSGAVDPSRLTFALWRKAPLAAPILFSAFGFHNIVPPLASYLKRDKRVLRWALFWGTFIPFAIYVLWQWVIIGAIDQTTILETLNAGYPVTNALFAVAGHGAIPKLAIAFAFFAIVTSTLGVGFSLVDFLGDGFRVQRVGATRAWLTLLTFVPPLIIAAINPRIFDTALGIAGGFGEAYLNGLFPVLLVWIGRYAHKVRKEPLMPGGRLSLGVLAFISLLVAAIELVTLIR